jgi:glutaredoxin 3
MADTKQSPTTQAPKVTVYSKDYCPYCDRAKDLLSRKGVAFEAIELQDHPGEFEKLKARTGMMTVPQIFIGEKLIGGYTDMAALDRDGQLDQMLGLAEKA